VREVLLLSETCRDVGRAVLAVTRDLSALEPEALFVITCDGPDYGRILAMARYQEFLGIDTEDGDQLRRQHELYSREVPDGLFGFVVLTAVELSATRPFLDTLGAWLADGSRLTADALPRGSQGVTTFFVPGEATPSAEETVALLRARLREIEQKSVDIRESRKRERERADRATDRARNLEAQRRYFEGLGQRPSGRVKRMENLLDKLFEKAFPKLRFCGDSATTVIAYTGSDQVAGLLRSLSLLNDTDDQPRGKTVKGKGEGWFEVRFGAETGRLYFRRRGASARTLVYASTKPDQEQDISRLGQYASDRDD